MLVVVAAWLVVGAVACGDNELVPTVTGTLLAAGDFDVAGMTTDDTVAALDPARGAFAIPVAGTGEVLVDPASDFVFARGQVIFSFQRYDNVSAFGDLTIWTAAAGVRPYAAGATQAVAVSDDGTRILATQASSGDGLTTTVAVGGIDGAPPVPVAMAARGGLCGPTMGFVVDRFILAHCAPGSTSVTLSAVDPATGALTDLATDLNSSVAVLGQTGRLDYFTGPSTLAIVPITGETPPMRIELPGPIGNGIPARDGASVFVTAGGALLRVSTVDGSITTLVPAGVRVLRGASPDDQYVLYAANVAPRNGYTDLFLVSTAGAAASPPVSLASSVDTAIFGDAFTADGSRALYATGANDLFVGTLQSIDVAGAGDGAPIVHGRNVWRVSAVGPGARIVFNDNYVAVPKRQGRTVLRTVDTAAARGTAPLIIATDVGSTFALTAARDAVVFAFGGGGMPDLGGIYAATLP